MSKTLKMLTAAILLGSAPLAPVAFAQTTAPAQGGDTSSDPAAPQPAPAMPGAATPASPESGAAAPTGEGGSYLTGQEAGQLKATNYIGQPVFNAADESVGKVTDLVVDAERRIVAVVVGVGGFLGIGEKNVALPVDAVTANRDPENGTVKLVTTETAESLKAAPEFKEVATQ